MSSFKTTLDAILRQLEADHGCQVRITKSGHWRISRPGHQAITTSRSPSDRRALKNIESDIRRYLGVDVRKR